jgi:tight adherence protein C
MLSELMLTAAISALLMIGGAAMVASAVRSKRSAISNRVELIVPAQGSGAAAPGRADARPATAASLIRAPAGRLNQAELREVVRACRRLGIPPRYADPAYLWLRILTTLVLAVAGYVVAATLLKHSPPIARPVSAAGFAIAGWLAPAMILSRFAKQRSAAAADGLPEALELLVVCVEAGLSLEDAIDRITEDLKWSRPALAEELALTSADLKILPDRDRALANLAERIDAPSVRSVVTALSQTLRYGTPLAQALRVTAAELRDEALIQMEERANRLPTLLTLPMMLFIMPTIFLIIGGPAALRLMDLFSH